MSKPICPSCGGFIPNNDAPGSHPGALSRRDNITEICSNCGVMEAFAKIPRNANIGPKVSDQRWEVIRLHNEASK